MTLRLPVTSIERYHLADDSSANPNVIAAEVTVSGQVDMDIATLALREATGRHLMLCARLEKGFSGRCYWNLDKKHLQELVWHEFDENTSAETLRVIKPFESVPSRCFVQQLGDQTKLSFRTHHAAVDGGGGLQLVADWLLTYHRISSGKQKPRSRATDTELLKRRNHLRLLNRRFLGKLWIQPIALLGATKFLFRKVKPVATVLKSDRSESVMDDRCDNLPNDFQIVSHTLGPNILDSLRNEAEASKATVHELVLRAIFLGIHDFRKQQGTHEQGEWLRLIIPISIRDHVDRRMPAANRATIIQLDRTDRDFADSGGLLWGLNHELGSIRKWNLEKTFLLAMRMVGSVPGMIARSARKDICRATSVVTNLGAPFERLKLERIDGKLLAGNLIVEDLNLIVPLRKQTATGFALSRYNGQLRINMHFDPSQISESDAKQVMKLVLDRIQSNSDA